MGKKYLILILLLYYLTCIFAEGDKKYPVSPMRKSNGAPLQTKFNINNISTFISNDGTSDLDPLGNAGFLYPKNIRKNIFYLSGLLWGLKVDSLIRVGGTTYEHGIRGGRILNSGLPVGQLIPEDSSLNSVRIFRVRKDYKNGSLASEVSDENKTEEEIYSQYEKDLNDWPANEGAPFEDVNSDGVYDPEIDIPGVPGADQTIWFVSNDLDSSLTLGLYGSPPIGIEVQTTIWGYNSNGPLGNMLFKKYILINKSDKNFADMYISMWSDPDLGDATDDYVGCDSSLSLGFVYNGENTDDIYGDKIPAAGFTLLQGPVKKGAVDDLAKHKGKSINGYKNIPMTAYYYMIGSDAVYSDPPLSYSNHIIYQGTIEFYNLRQGKIAATGEYFPIPEKVGGGKTTFPLSGNPLTGTGYIDGILYQPADRRFGISAGSFNMASGDTQEVIYAQIAGTGSNNLSSIKFLKYYTEFAQDFYNKGFPKLNNPVSPVLSIDDSGNDIILNWESNSNAVESFSQNGYKFEGYNIYQVADNSSGFVKIATFDVINGVKKISGEEFDPETGTTSIVILQNGNDSGIQRQFEVSKDYLLDSKFLKGKEYYFAVTAYAYSGNESPNVTETNLNIYKVKYHYNKPGPNYRDFIVLKQISGTRNYDEIRVSVYDYDLLNGDNYQISFQETQNSRKWSLTDLTKNVICIDTMDIVYNDNVIVDGFKLEFFKYGSYINMGSTGTRWVSGNNVGGAVFFGGADIGANLFGSSIPVNYHYPKVELRWAGVSDYNSGSPFADSSSIALMTKSKQEMPERWSKAPVYRIDQNYSYSGIGDIPFTAWEIDSTSERQLNVIFTENDNYGSGTNLIWDMGWNNVKHPYQFEEKGAEEYIFIMNSTYNSGADYSSQTLPYQSDNLYTICPATRSRPYLQSQFDLSFFTNERLSPEDLFTFNSRVTTKDTAKTPEVITDYKLLQNYPNPFNSGTVITYYLPDESRINIELFDILGRKIKTLIDEVKPKGKYKINFNPAGLSTGIYFYRLQAGSFVQVKKMMLLK